MSPKVGESLHLQGQRGASPRLEQHLVFLYPRNVTGLREWWWLRHFQVSSLKSGSEQDTPSTGASWLCAKGFWFSGISGHPFPCYTAFFGEKKLLLMASPKLPGRNFQVFSLFRCQAPPRRVWHCHLTASGPRGLPLTHLPIPSLPGGTSSAAPISPQRSGLKAVATSVALC